MIKEIIKKIFSLFFILLFNFKSYAIIPDTLSLANVSVVLSPKAKDIVETEFLLLGKNLNYVNSMLDKVNLFMPTVEKILEENNVPLDFKYLCIQESSLNPSAVSSSNAVGFWQFKKETAIEMGMIVNSQVDERKHLIESTRGAANYFIKNNASTNNWVGALLSYRLGLGGFKATKFSKDWANKDLIYLDEKTDWYILRYLANKLFWESVIKQFEKESIQSIEILNASGISIKEFAEQNNLDSVLLKTHNPWLLTSNIPKDKDYLLFYIKSKEGESVENPLSPYSSESNQKTHTVQQGETFFGIAKIYEMKLDDLIKLNPYPYKNGLKIGDILKIN